MNTKNTNSDSCFILFLLLLLLNIPLFAQRDLPNPPADVQHIPAGSYVIPMDNIHQSIVPAGQAPFNLKAYGLVNQLLQNGIPVKWSIKAGKEINDIDFTARSERIFPDYVAATTIDFMGGPFIVPDTVLPCGLSTDEVIRFFGNDVAVYQLTENTIADIRYTLTHRPKIAVFNNGGNQLIHTRILVAAGIIDYDVMDAADMVNLINCYTFASEPHADEHQVSLQVIEGIRTFVMNGGNFLAQCHAIDTYENRGFFHTTAGIRIINTDVNHEYPNADLSFSQINGTTEENAGGSVDNWTLAEGSDWLPYSYRAITHSNADTVIAMGAKLIDPNLNGGNVFYLGGHDYARAGGRPSLDADLTNIAKVNALRLYLNAALMPSGNSNNAWANAGASLVEISCSDSVQLGCEPTGPPNSTFTWSPAIGLSCTDCPNPYARPAVTTTYTVEVENGCTAIDTVQVVVGLRPVSDFTNTTVCEGNATRFTDETTGGSGYWLWNFGDPDSGELNTSSLQNPTHVFTTSGNFDVTLISGSSPECADTIVQTVVVEASAEIIVNNPLICEGDTAILEANGADTYLWSTGETSNTIQVNPTETTSYTLTSTIHGCTSIDTILVTVSPEIISFIEKQDITCFGLNNGAIQVSSNGGISPYTYNWSNAETTNEIGNLQIGVYRVVISDAIGCIDTMSVEIFQPDVLELTIESTDVTCFGGNDGNAIVRATGGTLPYSYLWDNHQITDSIHSLTIGDYTVTVTDSLGCDATANVEIIEPTAIKIHTQTTDVSCYGGNDGIASVNVSGGTSPYTYQWNTTPTQNTESISNLIAATYTVIITDAIGCSDSIQLSLIEPDSINISTMITHPTCSQNGSASVSVTGGTAPFTYQWNTTPTQTTATVQQLTSGDYSVVVTDGNNCEFTTSITLISPPVPIADFDFTTTCFGATPATFTDQSTVESASSIVSWQWDFGNPSTGILNQAEGITATHLFDAAAIYSVTLIVTTDEDCSDTITKEVEIYPIPNVYFGPPAEGCLPLCVQFVDSTTIQSGSIIEYQWNFGDSNTISIQQNPEHCYSKVGSYDVTLSVVSNRGCRATHTREGLINVHPEPIVPPLSDQRICTESEDYKQLGINPRDGYNYYWSNTGETTPYITVKKPGEYRLSIVNNWGCSVETEATVNEVCPPRIFIGNAFSPDNDGINDYFTVYTAHVGSYQLLIFNRWGEIIFEARDQDHFWDGSYRNEPMPVGVYPWVIVYEGDTEEYRGPHKMEGSVTVIR